MLDYRANFCLLNFLSGKKSVTLWWMSILMIADVGDGLAGGRCPGQDYAAHNAERW